MGDATAVVGTSDYMVLLDGGTAQRKKKISTITLSDFNNDLGNYGGWTSNIGDITRVNITAGTGLTGTVDTTSGDHTQTIALSHLGIQSLADPNDDRIMFWDDSASAMKWLDIGSNLSISGTTISASNHNTTYSQEFVTNGNNVIHRLLSGGYAPSGAVADDLQFVAGTGISLSKSGDNCTIALSNDRRAADETDVYAGAGNTYTFWDNGSSGPDYIKWVIDDDVDMSLQEGGRLDVRGDVIAYSTSNLSDKNLKENIEKVDGALDKVAQLDGVTFNWKKDGSQSAGVIAQNVEEVLPSAVTERADFDDASVTHKAVDYNQLSALFIEAIKELKEENKLLRAEIESLKDINK